MANSILGNSSNSFQQPVQGFSPNANMIQQIKQFRQSIKGDPKQQVMQMVQQGIRTNTQLQQAIQMAQTFKGLF